MPQEAGYLKDILDRIRHILRKKGASDEALFFIDLICGCDYGEVRRLRRTVVLNLFCGCDCGEVSRLRRTTCKEI